MPTSFITHLAPTASVHFVAPQMDHIVRKEALWVPGGGGPAARALVEKVRNEIKGGVAGHVERLRAGRGRAHLGIPV